MSGQRFYSEQEAREIFALAGVDASKTDVYTLGDLEKAASELGIQADVVRHASEQVHLIREEAADRREYRRSQMLPSGAFILWSVAFTFLALRPHQQSLLGLAAMQWLLAGQMVYRTLTGNSFTYEMAFQRWRFKRIGRVAPERLKPIVMATLKQYFQTYPSMDRRSLVCSFLEQKFGLSDETIDRMLEEFLSTHPQYARQLQRDPNYLI